MASRPVITLAVLQEAIQAAEPGVVLESFEMAAGSGRGDNYTAMLYRVALHGRKAAPDGAESGGEAGCEWRGSLICKVLPTSARRRDAYKSDALFRNEVAFYTRALPALKRFEERRGAAAPSCTAATPRCFRAQDNLVVLEDLRTLDFTMVDRRQGLSEKQLRAVLSRVARFHGLSLAMKALEPEEFEREVVGTIRETQFLACNEGWYSGYYRTINTHVLNMVHDGLPDGEERVRCLAAASAFLLEENAEAEGAEGENASFFKRMVALVKPVEPLAVLCHGDCWTNNFMFRYDDDGHIEEVMLVDYQMSRYSSPCLDLVLLLYSCTERPVREARMEALLRHYHATLLETMHRLGCTQPAYAQPDALWDMLTSEIHRLGRFGLGQAVDYVSCLCCDSEEAPNVYDGQGDDEDEGHEDGDVVVQGPAPVIIDNERCVRMMADLVQELVAKGDL